MSNYPKQQFYLRRSLISKSSISLGVMLISDTNYTNGKPQFCITDEKNGSPMELSLGCRATKRRQFPLCHKSSGSASIHLISLEEWKGGLTLNYPVVLKPGWLDRESSNIQYGNVLGKFQLVIIKLQPRACHCA